MSVLSSCTFYPNKESSFFIITFLHIPSFFSAAHYSHPHSLFPFSSSLFLVLFLLLPLPLLLITRPLYTSPPPLLPTMTAATATPAENTTVWDTKTQQFHGGQDWKFLNNFVEDFSVTTNCLGTPVRAIQAARDAVCLFFSIFTVVKILTDHLALNMKAFLPLSPPLYPPLLFAFNFQSWPWL